MGTAKEEEEKRLAVKQYVVFNRQAQLLDGADTLEDATERAQSRPESGSLFILDRETGSIMPMAGGYGI